MRVLKVLAVMVGVVVVAGAGLMVASESQEVVVLHSTTASGETNETRLWVVDDGETAWLRSGGAKRPWLADVRGNPHVMLERGDTRMKYRAVEGDAVARSLVDTLMREKYGLVDAIILGLEGSPSTFPVRLEPSP